MAPTPAPIRAIGFLIKLAVLAVIVVVAIALAQGGFDQTDDPGGSGGDSGTDIEMPAPIAP